MNIGNIEIYNYGNKDTMAYISYAKIAGKNLITVRVGNKRFENEW